MNNDIFLKIDIEALLKNDRKGAKRQLQIANRAIELISTKSVAEFSFEALAKKCRVTRTLIYRYFPTYESLLVFLSMLIRHRYQEMVIEKMKSEKGKLWNNYLSAALDWVDVYPHDASVWLIYFHQCTVEKRLAQHHHELVEMGATRIAQLLKMAAENGELSVDSKKISSHAKSIQFMITGYLFARATEDRRLSEWQALKENVMVNCTVILK